ncbi:MAG: T9SS type A sorting domain-containing protein [Candidatus Fermentibacteraceae bacterium]|nr:T9SS type A sorting domain-containing protein [Candidatus Fermentibacteraceae bacterium]
MRQIAILAGALLLPSYLSYGLDPPVKLWEKWYYTNYDGAFFEDIELTSTGDLFITAFTYDNSQPTHESVVALLLDQDGEVIWDVEHEYAGAFGYDGIVLSDGSFVITGTATEDSTSNSVGLFIQKISSEGSTIWTKIYDYPDTKELGYSITSLPDGGFAVCGRVHGTGIQMGQAWLLRTDACGDTLWTRKWGTPLSDTFVHYGQTVLYNNGELCMLAEGTDDTLTTNGPHLLFYDLEGSYLRGTDYGDSMYYQLPADMCLASDGGYTFNTRIYPYVWHTDQYGETLWVTSVYVSSGDQHEAFCIRQTMDSGYIFSGWDGYNEYEPNGNQVDYQEGWLVRFDSEGNELWNINNLVSVDDHFYSCLQLPQGGYMACGTWGGSGYLVRYAPETCISSPDPVSSLRLEVSPNPFSSVLSASFSLPEEDLVTLTVYDLYGRIIGEAISGSYPRGTDIIEWTPPPELGSGCYLVRLNTTGESVTRSCVFIR